MTLVLPLGMVHTLATGHDLDAGELLATIFTRVFTLFRPFVELVTSLVRSVGVTDAGGGSQLTDTGELLAAVFAITGRGR